MKLRTVLPRRASSYRPQKLRLRIAAGCAIVKAVADQNCHVWSNCGGAFKRLSVASQEEAARCRERSGPCWPLFGQQQEEAATCYPPALIPSAHVGRTRLSHSVSRRFYMSERHKNPDRCSTFVRLRDCSAYRPGRYPAWLKRVCCQSWCVSCGPSAGAKNRSTRASTSCQSQAPMMKRKQQWFQRKSKT